MIFIVGDYFQFNPRSQGVKGSIQEQMALAKRAPIATQKTTSPFDPRFVMGHKYRVALIRKITENEVAKIKYLFADVTDEKLPDIDVILPDTSKGDDYIAALSGATQKLAEDRKQIALALETDHGF